MHAIITQIKQDYERVQFNTVVSSLMKLLNLLDTNISHQLHAYILKHLLHVMHPICPQISTFLWHDFGFKERDLATTFPKIDEKAINARMITYAIQINGKTKFTLEFSPQIEKDDIINQIVASERIKKWIYGKSYRTIHVPGRLVNFVCKS